MDPGVLAMEFEKLARRLGIDIKQTADGPSGLCTVRGKHIIYIDRGLDGYARLDVFVNAFKAIDLSGVFVVPAVRRLLDKGVENGGW